MAERLYVNPPITVPAWAVLTGGMLATLKPSGDTTGVTDTAAINALLSCSARLRHDQSARDFPRFHRRCDICHPGCCQSPAPIDGREYHRRLKARVRRRRR